MDLTTGLTCVGLGLLAHDAWRRWLVARAIDDRAKLERDIAAVRETADQAAAAALVEAQMRELGERVNALQSAMAMGRR
jgi:hypothetical protein